MATRRDFLCDKRSRELANRLSEMKKMFEPGSGFGDPEARRSAEFQTSVILAELQVENNRRLSRIQYWGFAFVIVQTVLSALSLLKG
jgi:hypothetical protein